jgi:hypothetical protein
MRYDCAGLQMSVLNGIRFRPTNLPFILFGIAVDVNMDIQKNI